jgi:hypothetical protein
LARYRFSPSSRFGFTRSRPGERCFTAQITAKAVSVRCFSGRHGNDRLKLQMASRSDTLPKGRPRLSPGLGLFFDVLNCRAQKTRTMPGVVWGSADGDNRDIAKYELFHRNFQN